MRQLRQRVLSALLAVLVLCLLTGCEQTMERTGEALGTALEEAVEEFQGQVRGTVQDYLSGYEAEQAPAVDSGGEEGLDLARLPAYTGEPYAILNDNQPVFPDKTTTKAFETYTGLDRLGRCGVAFANVCPELMPDKERGLIGSVKPSGWQSVKYDFIDGKYLYNRCHLIGFQLTGENTNVCNLITGTRSLNVDGMLPFENQVADYVRKTGNHVLYRVTPVFQGEELVARGVQMEAWSVEDAGEGVCFNVWCWNAQQGITIDYATGESVLTAQLEEEQQTGFILNVAQKKFHRPECPSVQQMDPDNRKRSRSTRKELIDKGWEPCGRCKP